MNLLSGQNHKILNRRAKSILKLKNSTLEIIPTGYLLIDGGPTTSFLEMSRTKAISQNQISIAVHTALTSQFSGQLLVYINLRNGAKTRVSAEIISEGKKAINNPLIINRRIKNDFQTICL